MVLKSDAQPTPAASDAASAQNKALAALSGLDLSQGTVDPSDKSQAPVWWSASSERGNFAHTGAQPDTGNYLSREKAYQKIWDWYGTPDFDKWGDYLVSLGVIDEADKANPNALADQWYQAVDASANLTASGKKVKPWDAMRLISGTSAGAKSASKAGTSTSTTRSVNLTDPMTAKALVNDVLSKQLGRAATDEEINAFTDVLHSAQNANPSVSTETRTYDEAGNYSSQVNTSGGLDAAGQQQVVSDQAMKLPDYGAYQAATTYMGALTRAIQSPVPSG